MTQLVKPLPNSSEAPVMKMIFMKKLGVFVMTYLHSRSNRSGQSVLKAKKGR